MTAAQQMTQVEILRLANFIRGELLAGDGASAMRLIEPVLAQRIPFPLLDLLGQTVAQTTAQIAPGAFLALLDGIAYTQAPGAWPLIGSAIYSAFARTLLPSAMRHARRHIARAAARTAADAIGERVPGQLLVNYFEASLSQLYDWVSEPNPWVRRAVGVAVQFFVKRHPNQPDQIARLLQLLALLYQERDTDAAKGIGRGLKTIGRHQPEMLTYWLYEQREIGKQPPALLLRNAATFLPDAIKAEFLGVDGQR